MILILNSSETEIIMLFGNQPFKAHHLKCIFIDCDFNMFYVFTPK